MLSRLRRWLAGPAPAPTPAPARARAPRAPKPAPASPWAGRGVPAPEGAHDLVLYKFDACPWCQRVLRHAAQLGLDLPTRDTRADPDARRELSRRTGRTQVPCLFIDGQPLFESADINAWLEAYAA